MSKSRFINKKIIMVGSLILLSLFIRWCLFSFESGDYDIYLSKWYNVLDEGGLKSIVMGVGNYNPPYLIILYLLTLIPGSSLIKIKIVSVVFDFIMSYVSYLIVKELTNSKYAYWAFLIVLFLPTVILNSSMWAQCDSIYTTFVLLSLYLLIKDKYALSFLMLGIAFSFKLQFIFILPLYIIVYFVNKKFSILNFLLIPLGNIIMCLPVILMGMPLIDCFGVYFRQVTVDSVRITGYLANIWQLIIDNKILGYILIVITGLLFLGLLIYYVKRKQEISKKEMISIGLFSIILATYFLPYMHERYIYMADVISIIWYFIYRRKIYIPIIINLTSLGGYAIYLFYPHMNFLPLSLFSFFMLIIIICLFWDLKNPKDKLVIRS